MRFVKAAVNADGSSLGIRQDHRAIAHYEIVEWF